MESDIFVLDSHGLIVFLQDEEGVEQVRTILARASKRDCEVFISVVNWGEVMYLTERQAGWQKAQEVEAIVQKLPIQMVDVGREQALEAAHIKAHFAIAYADCFAAALALEKGAAVVTGDPEFKQLEDARIISVTWIGRP